MTQRNCLLCFCFQLYPDFDRFHGYFGCKFFSFWVCVAVSVGLPETVCVRGVCVGVRTH